MKREAIAGAAQVVSLRVRGQTCYAVWIGDAVDPKNSRLIRGARLMNVYTSRAAALLAAKAAIGKA